MKKIKAPQKWT